ncbi:MAG: MmcQ/YjbR family DNA-binding protein [Nitratireductor sp.]|nr:MmcQ/YjbR family DNA-binding protein [Nitratireductor sp.]
MTLEGTVSAPHFDRTAFKVKRTFATLAADGKSANLKLTPDEQEFHCMMNATAYAPVAGGWGAQGWTTVDLGEISGEELATALETAWHHALPVRRKR